MVPRDPLNRQQTAGVGGRAALTSAPHGIGASLRPAGDRAQVAARLGGRAHLVRLQRRGRRDARLVRARDAAVPLGRAPHRPPEELLGRRRRRPLPPAHGPAGAAPDGLRRLRPAGREPRHQDRRAPADLDREVDRGVPGGHAVVGHLDRLVARVRHPRAALLPLDAVDLPGAVRAWPGLPQGGGRQLVPQGRDRARQRAGHRRALRALRHRGRAAPARAVVLPHHRLRRPPARRPGDGPVAAARGPHAAQLDRALRGRRGDLHAARPGRRLPGLHDPAGHAVRRHVLRHGARASRRPAPGRRNRARAGGAPVRQPRAVREQRGARRHRAHEDRRPARPHGRSTRSTASGSRCSSPTTC